MKLSQTAYNLSDPKKWLEFAYPSGRFIDLIFAMRLAAYAESKNRPMKLTGYRSIEQQKQIWESNGGTFKKGEWVWPAGKRQTVATPGNSWHQFRLAVDVKDDGFWKDYLINGDYNRQVCNQEMNRFGICLPMNKVNGRSVFEWWHLQPIDTYGYYGNRATFLDDDALVYGRDVISQVDAANKMPVLRYGDRGDKVSFLQAQLQRMGMTIKVDGDFGNATKKAVMDFQKKNGITPDGVVGIGTWKFLL